MLPIESLIFDLDGTLVDSAPDIADALNLTLQEFGKKPKSLEEVKALVGDGVSGLLLAALGVVSLETIGLATQSFLRHYEKNLTVKTQLYPDVQETLLQLPDFPKAVVSNKPYSLVVKTLEHFGLTSYFSAVLGAESAERKKPDPAPLFLALKTLQRSVNSALVIGDGTADMQAANAAGAQSCAVLYGYRSVGELQSFNPTFRLNQMKDLPALLREAASRAA